MSLCLAIYLFVIYTNENIGNLIFLENVELTTSRLLTQQCYISCSHNVHDVIGHRFEFKNTKPGHNELWNQNVSDKFMRGTLRLKTVERINTVFDTRAQSANII